MLISLFFATLLLFMVIAMFIGAPLVPSKQPLVAKMIALLKLKAGDTLYDLGSGDGRLLIAAAQKGAHAVGIEVNPYAVLWSKLLALVSGQGNRINVYWGNYWWKSVAAADAVVVYAMPGFMPKMAKKFKKELKPGTLVVSNSFQIPTLTLLKQETVGKDRIYLYRV